MTRQPDVLQAVPPGKLRPDLRTSRTWLLLLWVGLPALLVGQSCVEPPTTAATSRPAKEYAGFEFVTRNVGGVTLHVEAPLAKHADEFAKILQTHLKDEEAVYRDLDKVAKRTDEILADIHRLVGVKPDDKMVARHREVFAFFLGGIRLARPGRPATVYLLGRQSVKEYLRKGNVLPLFSYDKDKDKVSFYTQWGRTRKPEPNAVLDLPVPLDETKPVEQLKAFFQTIRDMLDENVAGMAIHEVTEMNIVYVRLKPADPWFRWFSDGFANALTIHLLEKYCGHEKAKAFAKGFDPGKLNFQREDVNLRYWPGLAYISVHHPAEAKLSQARYSYATQEARRVIDAHGVDVVARILDKACTSQPTSSRRLIAAVKEVTGEDMLARLQKYQTYASVGEGIRKYNSRYAKACKDGNMLDAMQSLLRMHELGSNQPVGYAKIMLLISKRGLPAVAYDVFKNRTQMAIDYNTKENQVAWLSAFLTYAILTNRADSALEQADQLLELHPDNVIAMVVRLKHLHKEGSLELAEELARKVIDLIPDRQSPPRVEAARILREVLQAKREAARDTPDQRRTTTAPSR